MLKIYLVVIGFSYVAVCLLFSSLFLFRIVRIRRRRKVHVRYISSVMRFLYVILSLCRHFVYYLCARFTD